MRTIGERIEHARRVRGLTHDSLAMVLGIAANGPVKVRACDTEMSVSRVLAYAEALQVCPGWLAFGVPLKDEEGT